MDTGFHELSFSSLVYESDEIIFDYLNSVSGLDALSSADPTSLPDIVPSGSVTIHNDEDSTETNSQEEEYLTFSLLVAPSADSPTCDLPLFTNEDLSFLDDIPTTSSQSKPPPDLLAHCVIDLVSTVEPSSNLYVQLNQECEAKTEDDEQSKGMKFFFLLELQPTKGLQLFRHCTDDKAITDVGNVSTPLSTDQEQRIDWFIIVGNVFEENNDRKEKESQPTASKENEAEKCKKKREQNKINAQKFRLECKNKIKNMEDRSKALKDAIISLNSLVTDFTDVSEPFRVQLANAFLLALEEDSAQPLEVEAPPQKTKKDTRSLRDKNNEAVKRSRQKSKDKNNRLFKHVRELEAALQSLHELSFADIPDDIRLQLEKAAVLLV